MGTDREENKLGNFTDRARNAGEFYDRARNVRGDDHFGGAYVPPVDLPCTYPPSVDGKPTLFERMANERRPATHMLVSEHNAIVNRMRVGHNRDIMVACTRRFWDGAIVGVVSGISIGFIIVGTVAQIVG